jgi:hypothetical protein
MSGRRVLIASLVGTTIEFFDFYIYATAAVLVFPRLFFPASDAASATLQSFATFALAFLPARWALRCSAISAIASDARRRSSPRYLRWGCQRC